MRNQKQPATLSELLSREVAKYKQRHPKVKEGYENWLLTKDKKSA